MDPMVLLYIIYIIIFKSLGIVVFHMVLYPKSLVIPHGSYGC